MRLLCSETLTFDGPSVPFELSKIALGSPEGTGGTPQSLRGTRLPAKASYFYQKHDKKLQTLCSNYTIFKAKQATNPMFKLHNLLNNKNYKPDVKIAQSSKRPALKLPTSHGGLGEAQWINIKYVFVGDRNSL